MYYFALATDYDGTLAAHGRVDDGTVAALERLRSTGRRLILVTGRELDDLVRVFPRLDLFDRVVAENGALLYLPAEGREEPLAPPPLERFVARLHERGVDPLSVGRAIVSTWEPNEITVLETIHELGLDLQITFNKGAVMVLPPGVTKASGTAAALGALGLSPHNVVGIGDAENDLAFLRTCGCAVAVANALPMVKEQADLVTAGARGVGVVELADRLVANDLADLELRRDRHGVLLGTAAEGREIVLRPRRANILVAGTSGGGKSTLTTGLLEHLGEQGYQFCIIDPEGDYEEFEGAVAVGDAEHAPSVAQALELLNRPDQSIAVGLLGIVLADRPAFFAELLPRLQEMRSRLGRPHWIVIDEAHHMLPATWLPAGLALPRELTGTILITVHPDQIAPAVLSSVDMVVAVGRCPDHTIGAFCTAVGEPAPAVAPEDLPPGEALAWDRRSGGDPVRFRIVEPRLQRRRHLRKYAEGRLGQDRSFFFRGPDGRLNLRAYNLDLFLQLAEGVDDATWLHHLRQGDYSRWFRDAIKDNELAADAARIEAHPELPAAESRSQIRAAVERRYTAPA